MTVQIHELISWAITLIALTLFYVERKKNNNTSYYMVLQGLLKSCHEKVKVYAHLSGEFEQRDKRESVLKIEHVVLMKTVYSDYFSLMQSIMGFMKAFNPDKDIPFDLNALINTNITEQGSKNSSK